jgi:Flp pilus assembly protein TadG
MRIIRMTYQGESTKARTPVFRHDLRESNGQAFVELALVLPIFILLLVGAVEVGRLAYASIEVSNAARAGVAYGAQTGTTASDLANIQLAAQKDAPNITTLVATATLSCSCETSAGVLPAPGSCDNGVINLTTCPSPSHIVEYVKVTTTAPVNTVFHFPGIPSQMTFRGFALMRVEQ